MNEGAPFLKPRLELRTTLSRLDAVFEACNRLPDADKEFLYEEIRKRVVQHAPPAVPVHPSLTFIDRCRELAANAPNDKVRNALLMIVRACEADAA